MNIQFQKQFKMIWDEAGLIGRVGIVVLTVAFVAFVGCLVVFGNIKN